MANTRYRLIESTWEPLRISGWFGAHGIRSVWYSMAGDVELPSLGCHKFVRDVLHHRGAYLHAWIRVYRPLVGSTCFIGVGVRRDA